MKIEWIVYRKSPVIAALIIIACVVCTGGAFASFITPPVTETGRISDYSLTTTGWNLISYENGNSMIPLINGSEITLKFNNDGSITGSGGINHLFGSYTRSGTMITFGAIGSTEMAGPEPMMEQESTYFRLLDSVRSFQITGDILELSDVTGHTILTYKADNSGNTGSSNGKNPAAVLPGTEWQLSSYSHDNTLVSGSDVSTITLRFDDAVNLTGFGGVNRYFGDYTIDGSTIFIGPLGSTKMAGPEHLMNLETAYFSLLSSAAGIKVTGNSLVLTDANDTILLTFVPNIRAPQDRLSGFLPSRLSQPSLLPVSVGQSSIANKERFYKTGNWNSSTSGPLIKPGPYGKGPLTIPTPGIYQKPSKMPRLNDSIIPPVTYPGGPLL
jgi:heat shock protein HslJ